MPCSYLYEKIRRRFWAQLVKRIRRSRFYPLIYQSWWHSKLSRKKKETSLSYISAIPNPGAGIGHQMANWIAGLWFADKFGLPHAHITFSSKAWEELLGFGESAISVDILVELHGYRKVLLPLFDENNQMELMVIQQIMTSYEGRKVVFVLEQDQFYQDQYGVMEQIQTRFYSASSRAYDCVRYNKQNFNIAIHVRRGDIVAGLADGNHNHLLRWQDSTYFINVLKNIIRNLTTNRDIKIYLFSQGSVTDFLDFEALGNVELCLDMDAQSSFLHMVYADLLITSKSSFSYKPALLSRGIKVCPRNFWHGYPERYDWLLADENGSLDARSVAKLTSRINTCSHI